MSKSIADDPRIGVTHNRALCCECGQLRLVSANGGYRPPHWVGEGMSDSSEIASWGYDPEHVEPRQRATGALKCKNCGVKTTHAVLRDCAEPEHRDYCERRMGSAHATAESPELALRLAGVRIFELDEPLAERGLYIQNNRVLLVDGRLDSHDRRRLYEQTLKIVTEEPNTL